MFCIEDVLLWILLYTVALSVSMAEDRVYDCGQRDRGFHGDWGLAGLYQGCINFIVAIFLVLAQAVYEGMLRNTVLV